MAKCLLTTRCDSPRRKNVVDTARLKLRWSAGLIAMVTLTQACGEQTADAFTRIQSLEQEAFVGDSLRPDVRRQLMVTYADLARQHPDHPFVPEGLFRRADLLVSAGKYEQAVLQLQDLHDGFPTYEWRARCAFLVAFIHDVHLRDPDLARRAYERVKALHPGTPEAEMASQSLKLLPQRP